MKVLRSRLFQREARAIVSLPPGKDFFQSVNLGIDYKHFDQNVSVGVGTPEITAPITYYPLSVNYSATWLPKGSLTEFNAGLYFHIRGLGSSPQEFENSRFRARCSGRWSWASRWSSSR